MDKTTLEKEYEFWLFRYTQATKQKNIQALKVISLKLNELRKKINEEENQKIK